jgi:uracil phosphoribosyltransferase
MKIPSNFHIVEHPLIQHNLTLLRDKDCPSPRFRALLANIALLMGYEVLRDLPMTTQKIETPLEAMDAPVLKGTAPTLIPVLRAGLGMADPLLSVVPSASVGHVGVYRDHVTKEAIEYLVRLPKNEGQTFVVVDPMLATGNSLVHVVGVLNKNGIDDSHIRVMALVAAPEGVKAFTDKHPTIPVFCAALDDHLNENAYIVPGLGDAGDRCFGT